MRPTINWDWKHEKPKKKVFRHTILKITEHIQIIYEGPIDLDFATEDEKAAFLISLIRQKHPNL